MPTLHLPLADELLIDNAHEAFSALSTRINGSDDIEVGDYSVRIEDEDGLPEGSRDTDVPSITLMDASGYPMTMTWQQARAVAVALLDVTEVADRG